MVQRHPLELQALLTSTLTHRQVRQPIEPIHPLVVDLRKPLLHALGQDQIGDAAIAEPSLLVGQRHDALAHAAVELRALRWMAPAVFARILFDSVVPLSGGRSESVQFTTRASSRRRTRTEVDLAANGVAALFR
jgi:hypothetical protein